MSGQLNTASSQQFCDQSVFIPSTSKMGSWEHRPSFHCAVLTCDSMLEPCHTNPFFKSSIRIYQYVTLISLSRGISWLLFHPICCCVSDSLPLSFFKKRKFVLIIQWFICAFKKNNFYYCVGFGACVESVLPLWILEPGLKWNPVNPPGPSHRTHVLSFQLEIQIKQKSLWLSFHLLTTLLWCTGCHSVCHMLVHTVCI